MAVRTARVNNTTARPYNPKVARGLPEPFQDTHMNNVADNLKAVTKLPPLPERPADSHKGMFGRVLVVGGSAAMPGSIALVANSAYRSGAGLVRIFCPASAQPIAITLAPCATSYLADESNDGGFSLRALDELGDQAAQHDVLAVGPGMDVTLAGTRLVETALSEIDKPVVLDASGLTCLASLGRVPAVKGPLIITPHPGEMHRLLKAFDMKLELTQDDASRRRVARAVADRLGCVVLLKGDRTVVTDGSQAYINTTGNPGLATGGTGDVLTGATAALLAQHFEPFEAACLAAYLHGLAGDIAAERFGQYSLMATDLLDTLPEAFQQYART